MFKKPLLSAVIRCLRVLENPRLVWKFRGGAYHEPKGILEFENSGM